jgi:GH24 family phage-related lysozyme (muramidase)
MTMTPNLGITLLAQSQQQKEVTVNAALNRVNALVSFTFNLGVGA